MKKMKLIDQVKMSINEYPSLYKGEDFEKSKLSVYNQLFFVIGNGYEWAEPKDPKRGGYLLEPSSYRRHGEWVRKIDPPYGKEKYDGPELDDQYFKDKIFYISEPMNGGQIVEITNRKREYGDKVDPLIRFTGIKDYDDKDKLERLFNAPRLVEACSKGILSPYPICNYSAVRELYDGKLFIQDDWLEGMIELVKYAVEFYTTEELYIHDFHYPKQSRIEADQNQLMGKLKKEGFKGYQELRKLWGYEFYETVEERKQRGWIKHQKTTLAFLEKFLKRYDV